MADKILAQALVDYAQYDKLLEWQRLIPWINNFGQKVAKGTFDKKRAEKALADYLAKDTYFRYIGQGDPRRGQKLAARGAVDAETRLVFGKLMLAKLMPRIKRTAQNMKAKGLVKGKLNLPHPDTGRLQFRG